MRRGVAACARFMALALAFVALDCRADGTSSSPTNSVRPELWFPVGEELVYTIHWGVIPVGSTRISTGWTERGGRTLLLVRYRTQSNKVIASLYPVDDTIETLIDPEPFLPVTFEVNLKEGRRRYHEITEFDHKTLTARWRSLLSRKEKVFPIDADTRDLVTFMYFMRSQPLKPGDEKQYRVMADEKIYDLQVKAAGEERIDLEGFGTVCSLRIEPTAQFNGLFVRKGKMTVWVACGDRQVCTRVDARVPLARVRVVLSEVHGPKDDFWTQQTKARLTGNKGEESAALREGSGQ